MTERKQDEKQETRKKRPNKQPHLGIEKKRKGGTEEEEKKKKNNKQYHTNQHTHLIVCDADKLEVMLSLSV